MFKPLRGVIGSAALAFAVSTSFAQELPKASVTFHIESQLLPDALNAWAQQAGVQLVWRVSERGAEQIAPRVVGTFAPQAALQSLLQGSGFIYSLVDDETVAIRPERERTAKRIAWLKRESAQSVGFAREPTVRVAEATDTGQPQQAASSTPHQERTVAEKEELEEVVVTGTHIRGTQPTGSSLITLNRTEIDRAGFATVQEAVRSLPQNFGGGPSENTRVQAAGTADPIARTNTTNGSALNLRGLGASSTLVLIDGRRLSSGGESGLFTDVSSIPLSAIERIEILPDGASAIYGSDAIGGVVNFILRKDYSGAETRVRLGSVTEGNSDELQVSQILGAKWGSGSALLSYEHYDRSSLSASARAQSATSDLTAFGGDNFNSQNSNPGTILTEADMWAIPGNQNGAALQPSDFVSGTQNFWNLRTGMDLYGSQEKNSVVGIVRQQISESIEIFGDGLFTRRDSHTHGPGLSDTFSVDSSNAFYVNPSGGTEPIAVQYNFYNDLGGINSDARVESYYTNIGFTLGTSKTWSVTAYGQFGREKQFVISDNIDRAALAGALADSDPATAFNPFGDGSFTNPATLASLRTTQSTRTTSDIADANVVAEGSLWHMASGDVRLAIGADRRRESFRSGFVEGSAEPSKSSYDRTVTAEFAELYIPLVGAASNYPGIHKLDLSIAGRHEDYNDFGSTTNPKVGLTWEPVPNVTVRATWGKSFRAPNLANLDEAPNVTFIFPVSDPDAGPGGFSDVLIAFGNNSSLQPETAKTWSAGFDFGLPSVEGLKFGLTYFDIDYTDRIAEVPITFTWLDDPAFSNIVIRNPTGAQREEFCRTGTFAGNFGGGAGDCRTAPIAAVVDARIRNTAITEVSGFDVLAAYSFSARDASGTMSLNATRLRRFAQASLDTMPLTTVLNTVNNPLRTRARAAFSLAYRGFSGATFINYAGSYSDDVSTPSRTIGSWTTVDFQLGYQVEEVRILDGISVSLNVQNAFDKQPPFFNNPFGFAYDPANGDLRGRFASIALQKKW